MNVDEAEQKGVEADFRMLVTDAWTVYAAFTYAEVEFTDGTVPCTDPGQPPVGPPPANRYNTCDANGENATAMPKWTGMLQTDYTWNQVVMDSDYYVSALWSYKGDTKGVGDVAGRLDGDSFSVVDVFTGLRNDVWTAQLYVKNAFDDDGVLNRRPLNTAAYNELTVTAPRSIGITGNVPLLDTRPELLGARASLAPPFFLFKALPLDAVSRVNPSLESRRPLALPRHC